MLASDTVRNKYTDVVTPVKGAAQMREAFRRAGDQQTRRDASTERRYFLRVPPTIRTAAEAVAWTFGLSGQDYYPALET
jgi:hypothetical protein